VHGLLPLAPADVPDLREFLTRADLTLSGLDAPTVRLWLLRSAAGLVQGSTGYEFSGSGRDVLVRSVAVDPELRTQGLGLRLAQFALDDAARSGARCAWLFSRRSGAFWQRLGFMSANRDDLATTLSDTHQVRLFEATGQLQREVAWSRPLSVASVA
jgi:N-acetylglutamate synthase-like GNAT family acetyltransferase